MKAWRQPPLRKRTGSVNDGSFLKCINTFAGYFSSIQAVHLPVVSTSIKVDDKTKRSYIHAICSNKMGFSHCISPLPAVFAPNFKALFAFIQKSVYSQLHCNTGASPTTPRTKTQSKAGQVFLNHRASCS